MKYKIMDWAGNEMRAFGTFDSVEDAWAFIQDKFECEADWDDYHVEEV